jgi:hypothetical protein
MSNHLMGTRLLPQAMTVITTLMEPLTEPGLRLPGTV